jgi:hypothetical protein
MEHLIINFLCLDEDILNIIGDYVTEDNWERETIEKTEKETI